MFSLADQTQYYKTTSRTNVNDFEKMCIPQTEKHTKLFVHRSPPSQKTNRNENIAKRFQSYRLY